MKAHEFLEAALGHMRDRAATYDQPEGERSMSATVAAFSAISGIKMSDEQGWLFMCLLKLVRSQQGAYKSDSYEDLSAYAGLMGESACSTRYSQKVVWPDLDDSPRQQLIEQSGELAEIYEVLDKLKGKTCE